MSIIKKIISHSLWLLVGSFISKLLVFLSNIVVARYTSPEIFGQYSLLKHTATTLEALVSGSISTSAAKHVAEYKNRDRSFFSNYLSSLIFSILIICVVLSIPFIFFPEKMVEYFFKGEMSLLSSLFLVILILFGIAFSNLMQNILIGLEMFKKIAWVSVVVSIISFPITFLLVNYYGLYGALFGIVGYFTLDFLAKGYVIFVQSNYKLGFEFRKIISSLKGVLLFSSYLFFSICINSLSFWYGRILLLDDTSDFEVVGFFDAAFQLLSIIYIITGTVTSAVLPKLSKAHSSNNKKDLNEILKSSLWINFVFAFVVAAVFIIFASPIMSMYGSEFKKGTTILSYLSVSAVFVSVAYIFHRYLMSVNRVLDIFYANLLSAIGMYLVLYFYAPITGETLAISIVVYYIITVIYYVIAIYGFSNKKNVEPIVQ